MHTTVCLRGEKRSFVVLKILGEVPQILDRFSKFLDKFREIF